MTDEVVHNIIEEVEDDDGISESEARELLEDTHFCALCQKIFPTKEDLEIHEKLHVSPLKVKPHMCPVCNSKFDPNLHSHPNKKIFVCGICKKGFATGIELKTHFFKHIQETVFTCHLCHKGFGKPEALKRHYLMFHKEVTIIKEKPYLCTDCGKSFCTRSNLTTHARVHSTERPYICSVCQRAFKSNWELKSHFFIHTNEKPYICKICDKGFRQSGNLSAHMRIHNNEKPYICKVCNKGFVESGKLRRHFRIHTAEKPYLCNVCGKAFRDSSNMKAHTRIHNKALEKQPQSMVYKLEVAEEVIV